MGTNLKICSSNADKASARTTFLSTKKKEKNVVVHSLKGLQQLPGWVAHAGGAGADFFPLLLIFKVPKVVLKL